MLYSKFVWKLSITLPPNEGRPAPKAISPSQEAPWLEYFSLKVSGLSRPFPTLPRLFILHVHSGAPNLRALCVASWSSTLRVHSPQVSLTETRLWTTSLFVGGHPWNARIHSTPANPPSHTRGCNKYANLPAVNLTHLRELSIVLYHPDKEVCLTADHFFLKIRAPSISKLVLKALRCGCQWGTILNFLSNSSQPPIVKFSIVTRIEIQIMATTICAVADAKTGGIKAG